MTVAIADGQAAIIPHWLLVALREIGTKERPGLFKDNPRIVEYHAATRGPKSRDRGDHCSVPSQSSTGIPLAGLT